MEKEEETVACALTAATPPETCPNCGEKCNYAGI